MVKKVKIPVGKEHLTCTLFEPQNSAYNIIVIMVHGWSSSDKKYLPLGRILLKKGITSLAVNLRGHKKSPFALEKYSRKDHLEDVVSTVRFVKTKYPRKKLILLGKSYGGYLSAIGSSKEKVDCLILSQPALYPDVDFNKSTKRLIQNNPNIFRLKTDNIKSNKALSSIYNFKGPVLLIVSERDEEIPIETTQLYWKTISGGKAEKMMIKEADHSLSKDKWRKDFYTITTNWIIKLVDNGLS